MWYKMFMCERHIDIIFLSNFWLEVHTNLLFLYWVGDLQGDPRMWSSKKEEGNCRNCMCIWEGVPCKFHGPIRPFTYTSSEWNWIGGCHINEVDVFLLEVNKNSKKIHPTKGISRGCMVDGYVLNESFLFLCEFLGKYFEYGPWIWDEE